MRTPLVTPLLLLALVLAAPAGAVVVDGSEAGTTSAPSPDDPGWDSVVRMGYLTAVYLEDGWVLTADHVLTPNIAFIDGQQYPTIPGSEVQLINPDHAATPSGDFHTDLKLVRIEDPPPMPTVKLAESPAVVGEDVVMIGFGRLRDTEWDLFDPPDCPNGERDGWFVGSTKVMRWGTNEVSSANLLAGGSGGLKVHSFKMRFDRNLPTPQEAVGVEGDSGGAVFVKRSGEWYLLGIMFGSNIYSNGAYMLAKPGANCGTVSDWTDLGTLAADVYVYRGQILKQLNPDLPSASRPGLGALALSLLSAGVAVSALRRR